MIVNVNVDIHIIRGAHMGETMNEIEVFLSLGHLN